MYAPISSFYIPRMQALHATTHVNACAHMRAHTHTGRTLGTAVLTELCVSSYLHYAQSSRQCQQLYCSFPRQSSHIYTRTRIHTVSWKPVLLLKANA